MLCNGGKSTPVEIEFEQAGTLTPTECTFEYDATKYDVLFCKFDAETAQQIKSELENSSTGTLDAVRGSESGPLNNRQRVVVKIAGEEKRSMYYEPGFFKLGVPGPSESHYGYLELHDLHEDLIKAKMSLNMENPDLEDVFVEIYSDYADKIDPNLIRGISVNSANNVNLTQYDTAVSGVSSINNQNKSAYAGAASDYASAAGVQDGYSIKWDNINILTALNRAKKVFQVGTHIDSHGNLVVGDYYDQKEYIASQGRSHPYDISSMSIGPLRKKLKTVNIIGSTLRKQYMIVENPSTEENKFVTNTTEGDKNRFRFKATVTDTTVSEGRYETVRRPEIHPLMNSADFFEESPLVQRAKRVFAQSEAKNKSGTVTINMTTSKSNRPISISDTMKIASHGGCGGLENSLIGDQDFTVTGVRHEIGPSWKSKVSLYNRDIREKDLDIQFEFVDLSTDQTMTMSEFYNSDAYNN